MICSGCAHKTERRCSALTQLQKDACAFYQTPEELAAGQAKATKRLRTLSHDRQIYIANAYYGGKRVWR
jgi:hypothetical protein